MLLFFPRNAGRLKAARPNANALVLLSILQTPFHLLCKYYAASEISDNAEEASEKRELRQTATSDFMAE